MLFVAVAGICVGGVAAVGSCVVFVVCCVLSLLAVVLACCWWSLRLSLIVVRCLSAAL